MACKDQQPTEAELKAAGQLTIGSLLQELNARIRELDSAIEELKRQTNNRTECPCNGCGFTHALVALVSDKPPPCRHERLVEP